jgi:membrane dipeptidase
MRMILRTLPFALALPLCAQAPAPSAKPMAAPPAGVSERAMRDYRDAYVIDTHNDLPSKIADESVKVEVRHPVGPIHTDLPRLMESGITAVFMSDFVNAPYALTKPDSSFARAMLLADTIHAMVDHHPQQLLFATTAADVERAKREGKVAILIGVEGGHAIEASLDKLRALYARGMRYMTLTWNNGNQWAGAAWGINNTSTGGLTPFGKEVIHEMNRLGIFVDISHVSDSTFYDAVATSTMPVIASHSSSRALSPHRRNMTDDMLRAVAKNGGVVNVNFYPGFIDSAYNNATTRAAATVTAWRDSALARPGADSAAIRGEATTRAAAAVAAVTRPALSVLLDHFDHIAKVAGVDHVGIGSDFDGIDVTPQQMDDVTMLPRIAQGLLYRGYSDDDVKKILGGNMLRVMRIVLKPAAKPAS